MAFTLKQLADDFHAFFETGDITKIESYQGKIKDFPLIANWEEVTMIQGVACNLWLYVKKWYEELPRHNGDTAFDATNQYLRLNNIYVEMKSRFSEHPGAMRFYNVTPMQMKVKPATI
jgi:hypothetical protein